MVPAPSPRFEPVWIWGLPFAPLDRAAAIQAVAELIEAGRPSFFITANTHYAMLSRSLPELEAVNARAAFLLADGAPIVWATRWRSQRLPERVAGSDLIHDLCEQAAAQGHRVFLLGGAEGVASEAASRLVELYPGLEIVGTACPSPRELHDKEAAESWRSRIRQTRPHLLFAALGQPKGELWIDRNLDELGVPVCVQIGASLDFITGRVPRAPLWFQKAGLEWAYRLAREPRRLAPRYAQNAWFLLRMAALGLLGAAAGRPNSAGDPGRLASGP